VVGVARRRACFNARDRRDVGDRAGERHPHARPDQSVALHAPFVRHLSEAARCDAQADRALCAVLRTCEQLLGYRVQREPGRGQHVLVHRVLLV
jgi:hypothetical protein